MAKPQTSSMFKSKIHRATVTQADLHYEGSVTIDVVLLEAADILPHEDVRVWNVTRGTRLETYALGGERGSGVVCINGAAAHMCQPGDVVIIATFAQLGEQELRSHQPRVVFVDARTGFRRLTLPRFRGRRRADCTPS